MENKEVIITRLRLLLKETRAGSNVADLVLNDAQNQVTIEFMAGGTRTVNIDADSGIAMVMDVIRALC